MEIPKKFEKVTIYKLTSGYEIVITVDSYYQTRYAIETWERVVAFLQLIGEEDAKQGVQET